jgi:hypothetical protein
LPLCRYFDVLPDATDRKRVADASSATASRRKTVIREAFLTCLSHAGCACLSDGRKRGHPRTHLRRPSRLGTTISAWPGTGSELKTRPTTSLNKRHVGSLHSTMNAASDAPRRSRRAAGRYAGTCSPRRPVSRPRKRGQEHFWGIDAVLTRTRGTRNAYSRNAHHRSYAPGRYFSERYSLAHHLLKSANHATRHQIQNGRFATPVHSQLWITLYAKYPLGNVTLKGRGCRLLWMELEAALNAPSPAFVLFAFRTGSI